MGGGRPEKNSSQRETSLQKIQKEIGLHRLMALRWQQLAKIPEKKFEKFLAKFKAELDLLSMALLMKLLPAEAVPDPPLLPPGKYRVLYADSPWEYEFSASETRRVQNKYRVLSVEDICNYSDKRGRALMVGVQGRGGVDEGWDKN